MNIHLATLVICGWLSIGTPSDDYAPIIKRLRDDGFEVVLDEKNLPHSVRAVPGRGLRQVSEEHTRLIGKLLPLRILDVSGESVSDVNLAHLGNLVTLSELQIARTKVTSSGIKQIHRMDELEVLDVAETDVDDEGMAIISRFVKLKSLDISRTKITSAGIQSATALVNLERLTAEYTRTLPNLTIVAGKLPRLSYLDITKTRCQNLDVQELRGSTSLKTLVLDRNEITTNSAAILREMEHLRILSVIDSGADSSFFLKEWKGNKNIVELRVAMTGRQVFDALLAIKSSSEAFRLQKAALKTLHIRYSVDKNDDVERIELGSSGSIRDIQTIDTVEPFLRLTELNISSGSFRDEDLSIACALTSIESLTVRSSKITDASIPSLQLLKRLKRLDITMTAISKTGLDDLLRTMPKVRISSDHDESK